MNLFPWLDVIGALERTYATAILDWLRDSGNAPKPEIPSGLGRARAQILEYRVRSFLGK